MPRGMKTPRGMQTPGAAAVGGVFGRLGGFVVRWPLVVIGLWVALAAGLSLTFPTLTQMARERPVAMLPSDAPVMVTTRQMTEAFHESVSQTVLLVVLTDEKGLGPADQDTYRTLVDKLRQDTRDVVTLQDFISTPILRVVTTSKDHKAWYLPIGLAGELRSPELHEAYSRVVDIIKHTVAGSTLTANLTGPAATGSDLIDTGARDLHLVEGATALMVLIILVIVYRNPVTMLLPLITIGISLVTARRIVAGVSELGLGVSNQTIMFMTTIMAGAGVDYAVFLVSRYHDYVRHGTDSDQAVKRALASVGKVIAASAATVAVTFLGMMFTREGVSKTMGPALAIAIGVAFVAEMTLLPAMLVLAGSRGWITPRRDITTRFWRRSAKRIVRRPAAHLFASLTVLIILAYCASLARYNYDDRKTLPDSVESAVGYAALTRHFPVNSTIPEYLFVQSPHDLRGPEARVALTQMAQRVSQMPDIAVVRGTAQPMEESPKKAGAPSEAREVGNEPNDESSGANAPAENPGKLGDGDAFPDLHALLYTLASGRNQSGGDTTLEDATRMVTTIRALGFAIAIDVANIANKFDSSVVTALDVSPICSADPSCSNSLLATGALGTIADLAEKLQWVPDAQTIESAEQSLRGVLENVAGALRSMGIDDPGGVQDGAATVQQGVETLVNRIRRVLEGAQARVYQITHAGAGPADASAPLVSPDGHAARYMIQTKLDPFSTEAMDQINSITAAARGAQPNTALADTSISVAGLTAVLRDARDYYIRDLYFIIVVTILVVFLILIALLRAVVAPLYLIVSVVISYLSAIGIGVIFFQFILGQQLYWSIPALTFIVLVAVGADYNMLLISRMRAEFPHGIRPGVVRTIGSTGGVITAAGVIFAASMFGLLFASVSTMVQAGFIMGVGLLLDTFLVRTITVPAMAVLLGHANWWPSRSRPSPQLTGQAGTTDTTDIEARARMDDIRGNGHHRAISTASQNGMPTVSRRNGAEGPRHDRRNGQSPDAGRAPSVSQRSGRHAAGQQDERSTPSEEFAQDVNSETSGSAP